MVHLPLMEYNSLFRRYFCYILFYYMILISKRHELMLKLLIL